MGGRHFFVALWIFLVKNTRTAHSQDNEHGWTKIAGGSKSHIPLQQLALSWEESRQIAPFGSWPPKFTVKKGFVAIYVGGKGFHPLTELKYKITNNNNINIKYKCTKPRKQYLTAPCGHYWVSDTCVCVEIMFTRVFAFLAPICCTTPAFVAAIYIEWHWHCSITSNFKWHFYLLLS